MLCHRIHFLTAQIINIKLSQSSKQEKRKRTSRIWLGMRNLSSYCLDLFIRWNFSAIPNPVPFLFFLLICRFFSNGNSEYPYNQITQYFVTRKNMTTIKVSFCVVVLLDRYSLRTNRDLLNTKENTHKRILKDFYHPCYNKHTIHLEFIFIIK